MFSFGNAEAESAAPTTTATAAKSGSKGTKKGKARAKGEDEGDEKKVTVASEWAKLALAEDWTAFLALLDQQPVSPETGRRHVDFGTTGHGVTTLSIACAAGRADVVERMLAAGANHSEKNLSFVYTETHSGHSTGDARTPLWTACARGHHEVVDVLLAAGAKCERGTGGGLLRGMMDPGDKVPLDTDPDGLRLFSDEWDALVWAVQRNDPVLFRKLIDHGGANVLQKARLGESLLHYAAEWGNVDMLQLLQSEGLTVEYWRDLYEQQKQKGQSFFDRCVSVKSLVTLAKDERTTRYIVEQIGLPAPRIVNMRQLRPLNLFDLRSNEQIANDEFSRLSYLLTHGSAAVLTEESDLEKYHYHPLHEAPTAEIAQLLLDHGADVDAKTPYGETPLILASFSGFLPVVRVLLAAGADVNAVLEEHAGESSEYLMAGSSALLAAVHCGGCHDDISVTEICKLLLNAGADPLLADEAEVTPLWSAVQEGLKEAAAVILEHIPFDTAISLNAPPDVGDEYKSLLHLACGHGCVAVVERLLAGEAHPQAVLDECLRDACCRAPSLSQYRSSLDGSLSTPEASQRYFAIIQLLLLKGANVFATNAQNRTCLHHLYADIVTSTDQNIASLLLHHAEKQRPGGAHDLLLARDLNDCTAAAVTASMDLPTACLSICAQSDFCGANRAELLHEAVVWALHENKWEVLRELMKSNAEGDAAALAKIYLDEDVICALCVGSYASGWPIEFQAGFRMHSRNVCAWICNAEHDYQLQRSLEQLREWFGAEFLTWTTGSHAADGMPLLCRFLLRSSNSHELCGTIATRLGLRWDDCIRTSSAFQQLWGVSPLMLASWLFSARGDVKSALAIRACLASGHLREPTVDAEGRNALMWAFVTEAGPLKYTGKRTASTVDNDPFELLLAAGFLFSDTDARGLSAVDYLGQATQMGDDRRKYLITLLRKHGWDMNVTTKLGKSLSMYAEEDPQLKLLISAVLAPPPPQAEQSRSSGFGFSMSHSSSRSRHKKTNPAEKKVFQIHVDTPAEF